MNLKDCTHGIWKQDQLIPIEQLYTMEINEQLNLDMIVNHHFEPSKKKIQIFIFFFSIYFC